MITILLAIIVIIMLFGASAVLGAFGQFLLICGVVGYFIYFGWTGIVYIIGGFGAFFAIAFIYDKTIGEKTLESSINDANKSNQILIASYQKHKNLYASYEDFIENKPLSHEALQERYESAKDQYDSFSDFIDNKVTESNAIATDYIECPSCHGYILRSSNHCKHCKAPI